MGKGEGGFRTRLDDAGLMSRDVGHHECRGPLARLRDDGGREHGGRTVDVQNRHEVGRQEVRQQDLVLQMMPAAGPGSLTQESLQMDAPGQLIAAQSSMLESLL